MSNVLFLLEQDAFNALRGMISMWEVLDISRFVRSGGDMTMRVENNNLLHTTIECNKCDC